ncbi:putative monooxygenase p33MONOX [Hypomesus transpacificus]|uniref:putative monooxygenase p33MONOX n=1 Tax=Hypomesus transpacificus TaxID=137520 RepID=UPI001F082BE0|nr:putative monooxygenase p33MONOX [Hypomesus transpacificus]
MSGPGDLPALESGMGMGGMSLPIGMTRRALSYDDNMEAPMSPPPSDININNLWRRPVIPDRKFQQLAEEDESGGSKTHTASFTAGSAKPHVPVVKAKASSIIMNSLMTKHTQDHMYRFEQKAGLTDSSYTPHKGLTAEETRYHQRMPESFQKLNVQSAEAKDDKSTLSAQSTPSGTPQSSPKNKRRGWFNSQGSTASLTGSDLSVSSGSSLDMGPVEAGGAMERWGAFGPRPNVQKPPLDPSTEPGSSGAGGFALQAYRGAQKPTPMEVMKAQATRLAEDPASHKAPPKMEIPSMDGRRQGGRPAKLKHRDINILTPSGF